MSDASTGDAGLRRVEREADAGDPAASAAAEARRRRYEAPPEAPPDARRNPLISIPAPANRGGRPRRNPMWCRSVLEAGQRQVCLTEGESYGFMRDGCLAQGSAFYWYGYSVLPTVDPDNRETVRAIWEHATFRFLFPASSRELYNIPAKLCVPNPVLLPFAAATLDAVRLALNDKDLRDRLLRQSIFGHPMRDTTIMNRPIGIEAGTPFRAELILRDPAEHAVEFLFPMYGILIGAPA